MAKFELLPNLTVMGIQGAIFGVSYFIVKSKFVEPYLRLKDKRLALTSGSKDSAKNLFDECESKSREITTKINKVIEDSKLYRAQQKESAVAKQQEIVNVASKEARSTIEKMSSDISTMLEEEKAKIPSIVQALNDDLYKTILN